jgi:hypothetical protein
MDAEGASNKQAGEITQHQSPSVYGESLEKPEVQTRIQTQRHLKSRHVQLMVGFPIEDPPPPILTMINRQLVVLSALVFSLASASR